MEGTLTRWSINLRISRTLTQPLSYNLTHSFTDLLTHLSSSHQILLFSVPLLTFTTPPPPPNQGQGLSSIGAALPVTPTSSHNDHAGGGASSSSNHASPENNTTGDHNGVAAASSSSSSSSSIGQENQGLAPGNGLVSGPGSWLVPPSSSACVLGLGGLGVSTGIPGVPLQLVASKVLVSCRFLKIKVQNPHHTTSHHPADNV